MKEWDKAFVVFNKLREILPKLSDKLLWFCKTRKEDTILSRLHFVHSYLTHSFNLKKKKKKKKEEEPAVCVPCNTIVTINYNYLDWMCWFISGLKERFWVEICVFTFSECRPRKKKTSWERLGSYQFYKIWGELYKVSVKCSATDLLYLFYCHYFCEMSSLVDKLRLTLSDLCTNWEMEIAFSLVNTD